jgi:predicted DNA-binding transcriptional regulator YafY
MTQPSDEMTEKISTSQFEDFVRQRIMRADMAQALHIVDEAGDGFLQPGDGMLDAKLDEMLREAIRSKHLLQFQYKNQPRTVEPHDYGIQNGIVRLFCWQVGGKSSGHLPGWRMFDLEGIENCKVSDKHFAGNRDVVGKHHNWDESFIRVAPPENRSE